MISDSFNIFSQRLLLFNDSSVKTNDRIDKKNDEKEEDNSTIRENNNNNNNNNNNTVEMMINQSEANNNQSLPSSIVVRIKKSNNDKKCMEYLKDFVIVGSNYQLDNNNTQLSNVNYATESK